MKKIIYALPAMMLALAMLVSCSDDETNVSETLSVAAFYPTIVMDNTEVVITGTAMDQVTDVIFPGEKAGTDLVVLDNTRLKVTAPAGVSSEAGALVLKTTGGEITSRQTIRAANPQLSYMNPADVVTTYSDLIIAGNDFLLVDAVQFVDGNDLAEVDAMSFIRKSNSQLIITVPADAPIGDNIQLRVAFKNSEVMDLGTLKVEQGAGSGGEWQPKEIVVYDGDPLDTGGWAEWLTLDAAGFTEVKAEDVLRVYISDPGTNAQGAFRDSNWSDLAEGTNAIELTEEDLANGYYQWNIDEDVAGKLQSGGLIVGGQNYIITKVVYVTQVWVEGGGESLTDPITEATIMLNDYEPHDDGHDANWDLSWADSEATQVVTDEDTGNTYIRLVKDISGWTLNCNHQNFGTIQGIENYVVKLDILVEQGTVVPAAQEAQWVLADSWLWHGDGLIPETTNGKWITIRANCSDLGLSGDMEFGTKTNGLSGKFPAGVCFDNLRLDPID